MATQKFEKTLQQGLLDRLIDLEPGTRNEPSTSRAESLRQFRAAVKRDLEWLLNSTRPHLDLPEAYQELEKSLLTYGLPDVSSMSIDNAGDQQRLLRSLETAIELFEPRLARARVIGKERWKKGQQTITFHVEAILLIDPAPERISFDTVLEISKGAYSIKDT
jgi:type VI secretion system protein ImpF